MTFGINIVIIDPKEYSVSFGVDIDQKDIPVLSIL